MAGRAKGTSIFRAEFRRLLCIAKYHARPSWSESQLTAALKTVRAFFSPSSRSRSPGRICLAICSGIHPEREAKSSNRSPFHSTMLVRSEKDTMICMAIYSRFTIKSFFIAVHFPWCSALIREKSCYRTDTNDTALFVFFREIPSEISGSRFADTPDCLWLEKMSCLSADLDR